MASVLAELARGFGRGALNDQTRRLQERLAELAFQRQQQLEEQRFQQQRALTGLSNTAAASRLQQQLEAQQAAREQDRNFDLRSRGAGSLDELEDIAQEDRSLALRQRESQITTNQIQTRMSFQTQAFQTGTVPEVTEEDLPALGFTSIEEAQAWQESTLKEVAKRGQAIMSGKGRDDSAIRDLRAWITDPRTDKQSLVAFRDGLRAEGAPASAVLDSTTARLLNARIAGAQGSEPGAVTALFATTMDDIASAFTEAGIGEEEFPDASRIEEVRTQVIETMRVAWPEIMEQWEVGSSEREIAERLFNRLGEATSSDVGAWIRLGRERSSGVDETPNNQTGNNIFPRGAPVLPPPQGSMGSESSGLAPDETDPLSARTINFANMTVQRVERGDITPERALQMIQDLQDRKRRGELLGDPLNQVDYFRVREMLIQALNPIPPEEMAQLQELSNPDRFIGTEESQ